MCIYNYIYREREGLIDWPAGCRQMFVWLALIYNLFWEWGPDIDPCLRGFSTGLRPNWWDDLHPVSLAKFKNQSSTVFLCLVDFFLIRYHGQFQADQMSPQQIRFPARLVSLRCGVPQVFQRKPSCRMHMDVKRMHVLIIGIYMYIYIYIYICVYIF